MDTTNNSPPNLELQDSPPNCYFYAYTDDEGHIMFTCGWEEGRRNIENFAVLLTQLTSGALNLDILNHIGSQCVDQDRKEELSLLMGFIDQLAPINLDSDEIVIKPTEVKP